MCDKTVTKSRVCVEYEQRLSSLTAQVEAADKLAEAFVNAVECLELARTRGAGLGDVVLSNIEIEYYQAALREYEETKESEETDARSKEGRMKSLI